MVNESFNAKKNEHAREILKSWNYFVQDFQFQVSLQAVHIKWFASEQGSIPQSYSKGS